MDDLQSHTFIFHIDPHLFKFFENSTLSSRHMEDTSPIVLKEVQQ